MWRSSAVLVTEVDTFTIFDVPVPKVAFIVAGHDLPGGAIGLLGQNIFHMGDVEYDLANGIIRIMRPQDCQSYRARILVCCRQEALLRDRYRARRRRTRRTRKAVAFLNGEKIKVLFDTGSPHSLLTRDAAKRAGITPDSPGVSSADVSPTASAAAW